MWTTDQMLWRTLQNLCTDRGTVLWTNSSPPRHTVPDLAFFCPLTVGEKNFPSWIKITTNSAQQNPHLEDR